MANCNSSENRLKNPNQESVMEINSNYSVGPQNRFRDAPLK